MAEYSDLIQTDFYRRRHTKKDFIFVLYLQSQTDLVPVSAGDSFDTSMPIEQFPVEEWGKKIVEEYVEGKKQVNGTINVFDTPQVRDKLPSTQSIERVYAIEKRIAPETVGVKDDDGTKVDLSGITVMAFKNVHLTDVREGTPRSGLETLSIPWNASRIYTGEEWNTQPNAKTIFTPGEQEE